MRLVPKSVRFIACLVLLVSAGRPALADVKLPPFFSHHMVLQREGKAPIWGTAAPGEEVTVRFRQGDFTDKTQETE
jgi:sialate O-acetylesterase